jgi:hypothetical protein
MRHTTEVVQHLIFILFTAYRGMVFHHVVKGWLAQLPILSQLVTYTSELPWLAGNPTLNALLHPFTRSPQFVVTNMLMTPIMYVVLPMLVLLLLGARLGELGFGRGYRSWTVLEVVCFLPLVAILVSLAIGQKLGSLAFSLDHRSAMPVSCILL